MLRPERPFSSHLIRSAMIYAPAAGLFPVQFFFEDSDANSVAGQSLRRHCASRSASNDRTGHTNSLVSHGKADAVVDGTPRARANNQWTECMTA